MFCPSNETLLSITEKTKLLAQKCTQQIRAQSGLSPMRRETPTATFHLPTPPPTGPADAALLMDDDLSTTPKETDSTKLLLTTKNQTETSLNGDDRRDDDEDEVVNGGAGLAASLNCFNNTRSGMNGGKPVNARKKSITSSILGSDSPRERTTKWYVKVIQMAWCEFQSFENKCKHSKCTI